MILLYLVNNALDPLARIERVTFQLLENPLHVLTKPIWPSLRARLTSYTGSALRLGGSTSTVLRGCTIRNNSALNTVSNGGALRVSGGATILVDDCLFEANTAMYRAAVELHSANSATFLNCRFIGNQSGAYGAIFVLNTTSFTMVNCVVARNTNDGSAGDNQGDNGGGINLSSNQAGTIINSTIVLNDSIDGDGGGIFLNNGATANIVNSIVFGNTDVGGSDASAQIFETDALSATVDHSNVQGGVWAGTGNISAPPGFVSIGTDDFHLAAASPCINAGDDASVPTDDADLDGDADTAEAVPYDLDNAQRFRNGAVDMGAYESNFCATDFNGDGTTDVSDLLAVLGSWGSCASPCHTDTNNDGTVDVTDLLAVLGAWGPC
ncbi:MAG: hypothetical protein ACYTGG_10325 [Planctomycetota bacterium]|jgi:hypothetical protein